MSMGSRSRGVDWDRRSIDTELTMVQKSWRTTIHKPIKYAWPCVFLKPFRLFADRRDNKVQSCWANSYSMKHLLHKNQVNCLFRNVFFNINVLKNTKQYITHLMHDSDPVAYTSRQRKDYSTGLQATYRLRRASVAHRSHMVSADYGKRKSSAA